MIISFYSLFAVALLLSLICLLFVPSVVYLGCHLCNWTLCWWVSTYKNKCIFIIFIVIIIIIIIISFMRGIYTYIPQKNYVPREYSVAVIILLLFMVLISLVSVLTLLYFYISTFRSMFALLLLLSLWYLVYVCCAISVTGHLAVDSAT